MYKALIRPLLFLFPAETAHNITFALLGLTQRLGLSGILRLMWPVAGKRSKATAVFGLNFPNPLGLAAGFDKDARLLEVWDQLGFGFVEVGTVTPKPQEGNEKPRLFRLKKDRALINRMGFNNEGVLEMANRLERFRRNHPNTGMLIGGNIGKNKVTPNERASEDYLLCMEALYPFVDFFTINVSSPNTPGLRELQDKEPLTSLLYHLKSKGDELASSLGLPRRPILLKLAPDLEDEALKDAAAAVRATGIDGIIATNTSIGREGLSAPVDQIGGLSGAPLKKCSTEVLRKLVEYAGEEIPIVGVGGIMTGDDAREKMEAGARLIQVYSGFVYSGPALVSSVLKALAR